MLPKLFGALALLLLLSIPASAGSLTFTLDAPGSPPTLYSPPGGFYQPLLCENSDGSGSCVIFTGEIAIAGGETQDYFFNSLSIAMNPLNPDGGNTYVFDNTYQNVDLGGGNGFFLTNGPAELGPDVPPSGVFSYSGGIFEVDVLPGTPIGKYLGTATLNYTNATDCAGGCTASADFQVIVPEPGALILLAAGLAALAVLRRRLPA